MGVVFLRTILFVFMNKEEIYKTRRLKDAKTSSE